MCIWTRVVSGLLASLMLNVVNETPGVCEYPSAMSSSSSAGYLKLSLKKRSISLLALLRSPREAVLYALWRTASNSGSASPARSPTMIYVQAITDAGLGMRSPLDRPEDGD